MSTLTKYNGYVSVCDWEHNGDYDYPVALLGAIGGVNISSFENHGDVNTAYIYFECTEDSILPLLRTKDFDDIKINYPYSQLMPKEVTAGLVELSSKELFVPATMEDNLHSPLSWSFLLSYDTYLTLFKTDQAFFSFLSRHKLTLVYYYKDKYYIYLYGTSTLLEQFEVEFDEAFEDLRYYFPNKSYTLHTLHYSNRWLEAVSTNFSEVIYMLDGGTKGLLTTKTAINIHKMQTELEEIPGMFTYFYQYRKVLTTFGLDYGGTTGEQLVINATSPESVKFGMFSFPHAVQNLVCDRQKIELITDDGITYSYRAGNLSKAEGFSNAQPSLCEHEAYMGILYGLDFEYFFD